MNCVELRTPPDVGALAWRGVDRVGGRVALVGDVGRQLGHVGHARGRRRPCPCTWRGPHGSSDEQRRGADHRERGRAGLDRAVGRVVGRELGVPLLHDDLAAGDTAVLFWASPHALTASIEPWNRPGANGEPVSAITKIVIASAVTPVSVACSGSEAHLSAAADVVVSPEAAVVVRCRRRRGRRRRARGRGGRRVELECCRRFGCRLRPWWPGAALRTQQTSGCEHVASMGSPLPFRSCEGRSKPPPRRPPAGGTRVRF